MVIDQEFFRVLRALEREKDIPLEDLTAILKEALEHAYRKHFGARGEIQVEINWDDARVAFFQRKLVVDAVQDDHLEMSVEEAHNLDATLQAGSSVDLEVTPRDFGRVAAQTAKQILVQRIREKERDIVFGEYAHRVGEVFSGQVSRVDGRTVFVNLGRSEAILPYSEQVPSERYRVGDRVKAYLLKVEETQRMPHIVVSRAHPQIVVKLFALEVPEVKEGVVEIRSLAREPGTRTKIAVISHQDNVDPVGACVGHRGSRVQAVVDELRGEKIDIIRWSEDSEKMIASALQPARVSRVILVEKAEQAAAEGRRPAATVVVADDQLSLAIGREGKNVRLAANLTNWRIDIRTESQLREQEALSGRGPAPIAPAEEPKAETVEAEAGAETPDAAAPETEVVADGDTPTPYQSDGTGDDPHSADELAADEDTIVAEAEPTEVAEPVADEATPAEAAAETRNGQDAAVPHEDPSDERVA